MEKTMCCESHACDYEGPEEDFTLRHYQHYGQRRVCEACRFIFDQEAMEETPIMGAICYFCGEPATYDDNAEPAWNCNCRNREFKMPGERTER